jgi:hypothetical protein
MVRRFLVPVIAAILIAAPAGAEDKKVVPKFLRADNGLGAYAVANLGEYLGAVAFGSKPEWQDYQLSGGDDAVRGNFQLSGDCASSNGSAIAKALTAPPTPEPPDGVIRIDRAGPGGTAEGEKPFDMRAIYQSGQAFNCPAGR